MLQAGGLCSPEREAVAYEAAAHNSFAVQFSRPDLGGTGSVAASASKRRNLRCSRLALPAAPKPMKAGRGVRTATERRGYKLGKFA
jgi:hypothetical protein